MDKSHLQLQFDEFDKDHDGRLISNEAYQLLKLLGRNVYSGSVSHACRIINYDSDKQYFTFPQFKQYYESLETKPKEEIWKAKYQILSHIQEFKIKGQNSNQSGAAPGMSGAGVNKMEHPTQGDIQVTIGPQNQNHENFIQFILNKTPKQESKPYLKIVFEQNSVQEAQKLQKLIKQFHHNIVQFIKGEAPQYDQITDSFNVITNVAGNRLNLFITTSSQMLIDFVQLIADYVDKILDQRVRININFKNSFNLNISEYLKQHSQYSLYEALTRNSHMKLTWSGCHFKEALKKIFTKNEAFQELKYDKTEPGCLLAIALLHTDLCEIKLSFDNSSETGNEQPMKKQILNQLSQFIFMITSWQDETSFNILELISAINNNLKFEASVGDWKAQLNLKIKDLNMLFQPKQKKEADSD